MQNWRQSNRDCPRTSASGACDRSLSPGALVQVMSSYGASKDWALSLSGRSGLPTGAVLLGQKSCDSTPPDKSLVIPRLNCLRAEMASVSQRNPFLVFINLLCLPGLSAD